ncbi:MAG: sterol desaturase family protein [Fibrobacteria bacterium]
MIFPGAISLAAFFAVSIASFIGMEFVAWSSHKWIMHGPLWFLHESHHVRSKGRFEANDLFGLFFSLVSIALMGYGVYSAHGFHPAWFGCGMGMAAYGLAYLLMHDTLTHGRFGRVGLPRNAYLRRLIRAHRIHHAKDTRDGAVHFGFLWTPKE